MKKKIALFDLDHTLIPFDSDYEWNEFTIALGWRDGEEFRRANDAFFAQYRDGTLNILTTCALPHRPFVTKALLNP